MLTSAVDNNMIHVQSLLFAVLPPTSLCFISIPCALLHVYFVPFSEGGTRYSTFRIYVSFYPADAQFVRVAPLSETDNPEDDKVYVFFTEHAQEAEGAAGKVLYSRVARVCKVWSEFFKDDRGQVFVFVLSYQKLSTRTTVVLCKRVQLARIRVRLCAYRDV